MTPKDSLLSIGLNDHESEIYLALLRLGTSSPTHLEKHCKMLRPTVYDTLSSLLARNLIHITPKGKRKLYTAQSPDKLTELFRSIENRFFSHIEDLHKLYSTPQSDKPLIAFTQGDQAIRDGFIHLVQSLQKGDVYYRYSPGYELFDKARYLPKKYKDIRDRKQLERYVITNEDGKTHTEKLGRATKQVPRSFDMFQDRIGVTIYQDKVLIVDYDSESAITITHQKFADFQKKIFKLLYSKM